MSHTSFAKTQQRMQFCICCFFFKEVSKWTLRVQNEAGTSPPTGMPLEMTSPASPGVLRNCSSVNVLMGEFIPWKPGASQRRTQKKKIRSARCFRCFRCILMVITLTGSGVLITFSFWMASCKRSNYRDKPCS